MDFMKIQQSFADWNSEVDKVLLAKGSGKRSSDILMKARMDAFRTGLTADQFANAPNLPFRTLSDKSVRVARGCLWAIAGTGLLLLLILAVASSQIPAIQDGRSEVPANAHTNNQAQAPLPEIDYVVTAERLAKSYDDNAVAANETYLHRWVEVSGVVVSIKDAPPTVHLKGSEYAGISLLGVSCEFEDTTRSQVSQVKPGDPVTIIGKVTGSTGVSSPALIKCRFK